MPAVNVKIRGYVAGDTMTVRRTVNDVPATQVLATAWMTIKVDIADADPGALQKEITTSATAAGEITDDGATGTGIVEFDLSPAETLALGTEVTYLYDVQVKTDTGKVATVERGTIRFIDGVTTAT